jgi:hypothetical protein
MNSRWRTLLSDAVLIGVTLCAVSSSRGAPASAAQAPPVPELADSAGIAQSRALSDSAYARLDRGEKEEGLALFRQAAPILKSSPWGHYNLACGYARCDRKEDALRELAAAVQIGFDNPAHLEADPDLKPLRDDARFTRLLEDVRSSGPAHLAYLADGLPAVNPPASLSSADGIEAWMDQRYHLLSENSGMLSSWQRTVVAVDNEAQRIAAFRALSPPDTSFHEPTLRLQAFFNLKGPSEVWGPVADGLLAEAKSCLAGNPKPDLRDRACYWAGTAEFCRTQPKPSDPPWSGALRAANEWFDKIPAGSKYDGRVAAWRLMFDLAQAGENRSSLYPRLRAFQQTYGDDSAAQRIAETFFQRDLFRAAWPIPLTATDLDGRPVDLQQYRGKVLLLCYWATW